MLVPGTRIAAGTTLLKRGAARYIPGPGGYNAGVHIPWEDAPNWDDKFSEAAVEKMYELNLSTIWDRASYGREDAVKQLIPDDVGDADEDAVREKLEEMLGDVETEIGQEYEQIYNDAWWVAATVTKKDLAAEDFDAPEDMNYWTADAFTWLDEAHGIREAEAFQDIFKNHVFTDEAGVSVDLTRGKSRTATLLLELMAYSGAAGTSPSGISGQVESVEGPLEGGETGTSRQDMEVPANAAVEDELYDLAYAVAKQVVARAYRDRFGDGRYRDGDVDSRMDSEEYDNWKKFEAKWGPKVPALLGIERPKPAKRRRVRAAFMERTADDEPVMSGGVYLGADDDTHYFLTGGGTLEWGEIIPEDDLRARTQEYWESFFDDNPEQIADMMDRGYLRDVRDKLIQDLVDHDAYDMMEISEDTRYYSPDLDEDFEDKEEADWALRRLVTEEFPDAEDIDADPNARARLTAMLDALEEKTVYHSRAWNKDFDSQEDYEREARKQYDAEFSTYIGTDQLKYYASEAAGEVVDTDGVGHGLDVAELDEGGFFSLQGTMGATSAVDDEDIPEEIRTALGAALGGGRRSVVEKPLE